MTITSETTKKSGGMTTVTVVSDLSGTIYYHWFIDGSFVGQTQHGTLAIYLAPEDQVRIEAIDTNDVDFDSVANAPQGFPARRTLFWTHSVDVDPVRYVIKQQKDGGSADTIGELPVGLAWSFVFLTPRLDDLAVYLWQLIPVDALGNDGTTLIIGFETVVRTPEAPEFTAVYDPGPKDVTFDLV